MKENDFSALKTGREQGPIKPAASAGYVDSRTRWLIVEDGKATGKPLGRYDYNPADKLKLMEDSLLNLLAWIHRDGGHYTHKHGIVKSVRDAEVIVAGLLNT